MTFLFRYFYVNWFTFFVCFKLKSYINIKITIKGQKKNLLLGLFKFTILFFFTDLTAKNQPQTTTKPDNQIPGTNYMYYPLNEITLYPGVFPD